MDGCRRLAWLAVAVSLVAASGASCPRVAEQYLMGPRALPPQPTLEQVIEVVNRNSQQIQSFTADQATLSAASSPTLRATVAMQRPGRLRLRGQTSLTGPEIDLGSNDELFWFWARRDPQGAAYFCRHDRFDQSQARQMLPLAPAELVEALGLVEFDPALPHQGPIARPDGLLEIRTIRETPAGPTTRIVVIDPARGWVLQQHLFDARNQLLASAVASQHRRDPLSGLVMPRVVEIRCPPAEFSMRINLGNVQINTLGPGDASLWEMPAFAGARLVDLGDPNVRFLPASTSGGSPPGGTTPGATAGPSGATAGLPSSAADAPRPWPGPNRRMPW